MFSFCVGEDVEFSSAFVVSASTLVLSEFSRYLLHVDRWMDWIEWTLTSTSFCTKHARSTESLGILVFVGVKWIEKPNLQRNAKMKHFLNAGSDCLYFFDVFEEGVKFFCEKFWQVAVAKRF